MLVLHQSWLLMINMILSLKKLCIIVIKTKTLIRYNKYWYCSISLSLNYNSLQALVSFIMFYI
uniref:p6a n=1 Tax=Emaravirus rosae TaxID=1980433 RepID=A0A6M4NMF3_9VIRU|nr:p6a [Emaravirus rosae]